ncbi:MAG: aminopeptidase P family protein [Eubacterium sp.]|nr:aminopeptidase P family protein [Eubacterium sp.]
MANDNIRNRITELRKLMAEYGIGAYLIPSDDDHASEYVNDHFKCREWISGFTGSAGTVLVTADDAWLWTDGRYFLQAAAELEGSGIGLMKMGEPGVPTIQEKLKELGGVTLGFDGRTMTAKEGSELEKICSDIVFDKDLVGMIWEDRPALDPSDIWVFPLTSAGRSFPEKLADVRERMAENHADVLLICDLMETAWLFNLRGADVQDTPVFYSYAIVTADECYLFTLPSALSDGLVSKLKCLSVKCMDYDKAGDVLSQICGSKTLWADPSKSSYALLKPVQGISMIEKPTPVEMMKAVKNETEISATRNAHLKDGVAETKFIYWLKQEMKEQKKTASRRPLTELSACDKLESFRRAQDGCFDLSFPTIAGYMENGAIIHYEPTPESDTELKPDGFFLLDSGGQYIDGTTDITRTIALGPLTDKMRKCYTLVLKGHIDLAKAVFSKGTTGKELDLLARTPMKDAVMDYNHGTGHGVGHVLSVHEGPNYISFRNADTPIVPGMITSDEPGIYLEGEFGVRIESEILCVETASGSDSDEQKCTFDTITLVPLEREAIVPEMLTEEELSWLNAYHKRVYETVSPYLTDDEAAWLKEVTRPIG